MQFVDEVKIKVKAGDGGNGCRSFLRLKFMPKGGPDGGTGGKGGDITFIGDDSISTLYDLKIHKNLKAPRGQHGKGKGMDGAGGKNLEVRVPLGSIIRCLEYGLLGEILERNQRLIVAKGGLGGRGNACFKSATNQLPDFAESGKPGQSREIHLELKLIADVSLVGFPNAGKSTLISVLSNAKPKIADYPFTTLIPQLGIVDLKNGERFAIADIPGLIEGASQGQGLGIQFLKHISRSRVHCFLVALEESWLFEIEQLNLRVQEKIDALVHEVECFDSQLLKKACLLVINKSDILDRLENEERDKCINLLRKNFNLGNHKTKGILSSSVTQMNLTELKEIMFRKVGEIY